MGQNSVTFDFFLLSFAYKGRLKKNGDERVSHVKGSLSHIRWRSACFIFKTSELINLCLELLQSDISI